MKARAIAMMIEAYLQPEPVKIRNPDGLKDGRLHTYMQTIQGKESRCNRPITCNLELFEL